MKNSHPNLFYGVSMLHSYATVVYQRPGLEMVTFERDWNSSDGLVVYESGVTIFEVYCRNRVPGEICWS